MIAALILSIFFLPATIAIFFLAEDVRSCGRPTVKTKAKLP